MTNEPPETLQSYLESLPEWSRNEKMQFLFATPRENNPPGYMEQMTFWKRVLTDACSRGLLGDDLLCFDADRLDSKFARKGSTPLGLGTVLANMEIAGDLVSVNAFAKGEGWGSWMFSTFLKKPISWGFSQVVGQRDASKKGPQGTYVVVPLVQGTADRLLAALRRDAHYASDYVMSMDALRERFFEEGGPPHGSHAPSERDMEITLRYLVRRLDLAFTSHGDLVVAKIKAPKEPSAMQLTVSESDCGIVLIKSTLKRLHAQIDQLEAKITDLTKQAQERVRNGNKERALYFIRQKKSVTEILKKRLGSAETIEAIVSKIQSAETDAEVLSAYNVGADTLKSVLNQSGLTVEAVENTMDKLQDTLADQAEIDDAMTAGQSMVTGSDAIDDAELENELDALLAEAAGRTMPSPIRTPLPNLSPPRTPVARPNFQASRPGTPSHSQSAIREQEAAMEAELEELDSMLADKLGSLTLSYAQEPEVLSRRKKEESDREPLQPLLA
ncbi:Charged multivesicular body protein 7 [Borealophlyctis nickersoniae]|nr:Charged multivesicular body protein 7 [Borealophlyctis nickersoniae]